MEYNRIIQGNNIKVLPDIPKEAVNCIVTSPPYWGLRNYGVEPQIWDGNLKYYYENCKHEFNEYNSKLLHENRQNLDGGTIGNPGYRKNLHGFGNAKAGFCHKCGAWRGNLGLEPSIDLYIEHLCDIFDEAKRVLREDGTCWVNLGDSYNKKKSLCMIPQQFAIEMINRGWILRNTVIWHKSNGMPESAKNRFTVDFEYIYFFAKSNKTIFWTNEKTLGSTRTKPAGKKGIKGIDWEYRICPKCQGKGVISEELGEEEENICQRCQGLGEVKYSFWRGHDYWFEQQFEEYAPDSIPRRNRGLNVNKWTLGADGQTPHNLSQPRPNKNRGYKIIKQPEEEIDRAQYHGSDISQGDNGRNRRTVWTIATKSFPGAHFAVFPETLIEPIIEAGCPKYVCKKCGLARVKILEPTEEYKEYLGKGNLKEHHIDQDTKTKFKVKANAEYRSKGYTDCGCGAGFEKGITLDLFMGAGTTAKVALKQGKRYLGIELKKEYIDMANEGIKKIPATLF